MSSCSLCRYHLTKVALERKESVMTELEDEREKLIAKVCHIPRGSCDPRVTVT